jgi:hypothetical protein
MRAVSVGELPDNALRFHPGAGGHVESYFLRGNHPTRPLAFWLKETILSPLTGPPMAEAWFVLFDGEQRTTFAHRETTPYERAAFHEVSGGVGIEVGPTRLRLGPSGRAAGAMQRGARRAGWDLGWRSDASTVGDRLSIYPWKLLRVGPFPRSKLLTPFPSLHFTGCIEIDGTEILVDGWTGMQGHNWGKEHAFEYAWGQCLFPAEGGEPEAMVEGFSGRVRVLGRTTPRMSAMVVRRGAHTYRFDSVLEFWRQEASVGRRSWTVRLAGDDGAASLTMDAGDMPIACLGYRNPDGHLSYCLNTKLARVWLEVTPRREAPFARSSRFGGALEFLRHEPDPDLAEVILWHR